MVRPIWEIIEKTEPTKPVYQIVIKGKDRIVKIADIYNCTKENALILQRSLSKYGEQDDER